MKAEKLTKMLLSTETQPCLNIYIDCFDPIIFSILIE